MPARSSRARTIRAVVLLSILGGLAGCKRSPPCPDGLERCPSGCVDVWSDSGNCGRCGQTCGDRQVCVERECRACGRPGAPCCPPLTCEGNACCYFGVCVASGAECDGDGTCRDRQCTGCGRPGQRCCAGLCYGTSCCTGGDPGECVTEGDGCDPEGSVCAGGRCAPNAPIGASPPAR